MTSPPPSSSKDLDPDPDRAASPSATTSSEMSFTPASPSRTVSLLSAYSSIITRINSSLPPSPSSSAKPPRLVLVSKLKPASDILALHRPQHRQSHKSSAETGTIAPPSPPLASHFGENYHQELLQKSRLLPSSIKWHFIGGLQSNKCVALARDVRGLWCVESVDSEKKAGLLNRGWEERKKKGKNNGEEVEEEKLRVFIQVNTSGEESKSGVAPDLPSNPPTEGEGSGEEKNQQQDPEGKENSHPPSPPLLSLALFILRSCPHLHLQGLMTIGAIARSSKAATDADENEDFTTLRTTRDRLAVLLAHEKNKEKEKGKDWEWVDDENTNGELELSMGMSSDFEAAIRQGSNEVRIGSTVFGERPPKGEAAKEQTRVIEEEKEKTRQLQQQQQRQRGRVVMTWLNTENREKDP